MGGILTSTTASGQNEPGEKYSTFPLFSELELPHKILHLMVRLQSWSLGNVKYPFITIIPRFILTGSDNTYEGPIYKSNRTVQSFTKDYYCYY